MALWQTSLLLLACCGAAAATRQLQVLTDPEPQRVFGGGTRVLPVRLRNNGDEPAEAEIRIRLLQTSAATGVLIAETPWKRLRVLAGQTILESATVEFPPVRARTRFLLQWCESTNRLLGTTEVLVYPTNLLSELRRLAAGRPIGLFDPQNRLKPIFQKLQFEFADLAEIGFDGFTGVLAIVGPFDSGRQMPHDLAARVAAFAQKGGAVVWLQPPPDAVETKPVPTYSTVLLGAGAVIVAHQEWISNLAHDPWAQINLVQLAQSARRPEPPRLPGTNP